MNKKIMICMLLLLSAVGAMAQNGEEQVGRFSIIPRVGVAIANCSDVSLSVLGEQTSSELKSKSQAGFLGGVDFEYRASKLLAVSLGAYYARQGFRFADCELVQDADKGLYSGIKNPHANLDYVNVPLMLKAYLAPGFAVMAGAQMGFLCTRGKMHYESTELEKDKNGSTTYKETNSYKAKIPTKNTDVSIPVGLSYEYMNVILDARYNIGLTKVNKDVAGDSKNKVLTFTVGYRFTL